MTDENMDARLRTAGQNWRTVNTIVAHESDIDYVAVQPPPRRRRHWLTALSAAVVAAALVIGGFLTFRHDDRGGNRESSGDPLVGTWTYPPAAATVVFSGSSVRVIDACGHFTRTLTVRGDTIMFGPQRPSPRPCPAVSRPAPAAKARIAFHLALSGTVSWSIVDGRLVLSKRGAQPITLESAGSLGLDRNWKLTAIVSRNGTRTLVDDGSLRITPGHISWNDGCNSYSGAVRVDPHTLVITRVSGTAVGCLAKPIVDAMSLLQSGTVSYSLRNGQLSVAATGKGRLIFSDEETQSKDSGTQLIAHPWRLTGTETTTTNGNSASGSGSSAISRSVLTFSTTGTFTVQHRCYTNQGRVTFGRGTATLVDVTFKLALPCASNTESRAGQRENDFVDALLTGTVTWKINAGNLTITKGDRAADFESSP